MPKETLTQNSLTHNQQIAENMREVFSGNASLVRSSLLTKIFDDRRDIDVECGYPKEIKMEQYSYMYDREGVASRVVGVMPEDSWSVDPLVYEDEEADETDFEEGWGKLQESKNLYHYLHRIDVLSGIGKFGVLLLGLNDGGKLNEPVAEMNLETGEMKKVAQNKDMKLLYVRAFDESAVEIATREKDQANPRYGLPLMYKITFQETVEALSDGQVSGIAKETSTKTKSNELEVHWSRVLHVADNRKMSETYGTPRMKPVFNRLMDIRKVLSGSGEMFWKGAFPGYSFEVDPDAAAEGAEIDTDAIRDEAEDWMNGLQRYIATTGVSVKSLDVQVADPKSHLESQMRYIAITLSIPYRIFLGTEEAKLASGQDVITWNKRIARRQTKYLSPLVLRPFIDRLIVLEIIPAPADGTYKTEWVDLNTVTDTVKAEVAAKRTEALSKYVAGQVDALIPPAEFLKLFMELTQEEIDVIGKAAVVREKELDDDDDAEEERLQREEEDAAKEEARLAGTK